MTSTAGPPMAWGPDGELIYLLGQPEMSSPDPSGPMLCGHLGGIPPQLDLEVERQLSQILVAGSRDGMLTAAHDLRGWPGDHSGRDGDACRWGARLWVPDGIDPFVFLFSESASRALLSFRAAKSFVSPRCAGLNFPATRIGVVDSGTRPRCG